MLDQLIASGDVLVVSTGGGLPVWADNMVRMNGAGLTVYIRRSAEQIAARMSPHGRWKRPKLRGLADRELVEFMSRNMAERAPFYGQAALTIDGGAKSGDGILGVGRPDGLARNPPPVAGGVARLSGRR